MDFLFLFMEYLRIERGVPGLCPHAVPVLPSRVLPHAFGPCAGQYAVGKTRVRGPRTGCADGRSTDGGAWTQRPFPDFKSG